MVAANNSTPSTLLATGLAIALIVIVSMVTLTARMDNVAQQEADLIVKEFVTDLANTGILTRQKYETFESKLLAIGVDNIEMEIWERDENPGKKTAQANYEKIGEDIYIVKGNVQILPDLGIRVGNEEPKNSDTIKLDNGSKISVKAKSTNATANQTATSSIFGVSNADEYAIYASHAAMVGENSK